MFSCEVYFETSFARSSSRHLPRTKRQNDHIAKPVNIPQLLTVLERMRKLLCRLS
jgi:hypothetical protein